MSINLAIKSYLKYNSKDNVHKKIIKDNIKDNIIHKR